MLTRRTARVTCSERNKGEEERTLSVREIFLGEVSREWSAQRTSNRLACCERHATNRKGCDFGYALAAASCEGATGVDACTVTALGAITAFAVPDPG